MWDLFISHASEDKDDFVRPLAQKLTEAGLNIWFDEQTLRLGDSLRRKIDEGLAKSTFGIVVLSPYFFAKEWPARELDALFSREETGEKIILPIWHNVNYTEVARRSPLAASKLAVSASRGLDEVVRQILAVVRPDTTLPPSPRRGPSHGASDRKQTSNYDAGTTASESFIPIPRKPVIPAIAFEILQAAVTSNTALNFVRYDGGVAVLAGAKQIDSKFDLEKAALLEHAVTVLVQAGWLKQTDKELFHVTHAGYEAA
jgi:hypothetical protein